MVLSKIGSRSYYVNFLADFVLNKIDKNEKTIIKIVDCINFVIVKGKTSSNNVLDLKKIVDEFNLLNHENYKITHTVDLIEYSQELKPVNYIKHTYFNSNNCSFHQNQIDLFNLSVSSDFCLHLKNLEETEELVINSEFPYGYSLNQGRLLYYYGKHIFYSIPPTYHTECLILKLTKDKNEEDDIDFKVYDIHGNEDEILTSAILDVYDFDMSWLENEIKKVDWSVELTNPLIEYDFIKKINKDLVVI